MYFFQLPMSTLFYILVDLLQAMFSSHVVNFTHTHTHTHSYEDTRFLYLDIKLYVENRQFKRQSQLFILPLQTNTPTENKVRLSICVYTHFPDLQGLKTLGKLKQVLSSGPWILGWEWASETHSSLQMCKCISRHTLTGENTPPLHAT